MHPEWNRPYKCRFPLLMGIESVLFCIYCLCQCVKAMDAATWIALGVYFLMGFILYVYAKVQQKKDPKNWAPFIPSPDTVASDFE